FNVVHGDNGAGKSNLLEAIHYLGALKSFRGARSEDLIGVEEEKALLQARVSGESFGRTLKVLLARSEARKLALDDKRPRSTAHWLLAVPMVLFHPGDAGLAMGPPEPRRAYLDRILEQMDATYGATLASYGKALRSRNRLLKMDDVDRRSVTAYDAVLAQAGAIVGQTRARLVEDLAPRAERAFVEVAGVELPLEVRYEPRVTPDPEALAAALAKSYEKDRARGFTAEGPHADELALRVRRSSDAVAAKHHASQGQHRAIVLALKVAELDVLAARVQRVPILLLDDVSSELDRSRNRRLFELLQRLGGQVFLTTTHAEFILLEEQRVDFRVEAGAVRRFEG
ncbi:MAG: DNA replication and repair protein RecF, partial [Myxococcales bacterium]|nr:DNA replication and repair protein RecF [Myxococcales bacterium]